MSVSISVRWDKSGIAGITPGPMKRAIVAALRKAGKVALKEMRAEAKKRVQALKRLKPKYINRALSMSPARGSSIADMTWALNVSGQPVPLIAYPHRVFGPRKLGKRRQGPRDRGGVMVEVNPGKWTLVRGAFVATMKSGHEGIFRRRGPQRLPIDELLGSRPVDALLHPGEALAIAMRGNRVFGELFTQLLPTEIGKGSSG